MTSLSRKSRRTTAPSTRRRRTGFSRAVAAGLAVTGLAVGALAGTSVRADEPVGWVPGQALPVAASTAAVPAMPAESPVRPWPTFGGVGVPAAEAAGRGGLPPAGEVEKMLILQKPEGGDTARPVDDADDTPGRPAPPPSGLSTTGLPTRDRIFRLDSETALEDRIVGEITPAGSNRSEANRFEPLPPLSPAGVAYRPKTVAYPPVALGIEAPYVVHRRLYFEEQNAERYGWDAGIAQPVISTLFFYRDTLLWPARLASNPHERYDTNLGKCLPGSPVPYKLYPLEIDGYGALAGAGFYTGIGVIVP